MVKQTEIIQVLVNAGVQILEMYDSNNREATLTYYAVDNFIVPTASILEYQIIGYRVTDIINEQSVHTQDMTGYSRDAAILTKIQSLPKIRENISRNFSFRFYLPN